MTNEEKKRDLVRRVMGPQKEELASRVNDNINKSKKIELACRLDDIANGRPVKPRDEESCGCDVHFGIDPRLITEDGIRSSLTAHEENPDYDWPSLIAAGVDPTSLVSVESQLYQLVNRGTIRASAALDLLGYEQI